MEQLARRLKRSLPQLPQDVEEQLNPVIIAETNPLQFWSRFIIAMEAGHSIVLLSPDWPDDWMEQLKKKVAGFEPREKPSILIPTSGSSGLPKFCIHDLDTLMTAARGFADRFSASGFPNNVNVLPQHHVGGLMPVMRSAVQSGKTHFADYRSLEELGSAPFPLAEASISLVPTQLRRMLGEPGSSHLLQAFGMVLVGGAACSQELLTGARDKGIHLAPCYGSTETAAMITVLNPDAFLDGKSGVGQPFPHVAVSLDEDQRVLVYSNSNCHGYWPGEQAFGRDPLVTNDIGKLNPTGDLHILGRADRVIVTGGEKVIPEMVEAAARASGLVQDAFCYGTPDPDWGMCVELEVTSAKPSPQLAARLEAWLKEWLPPYAVPKTIIRVDAIFVNKMGKSIQKSDS